MFLNYLDFCTLISSNKFDLQSAKFKRFRLFSGYFLTFSVLTPEITKKKRNLLNFAVRVTRVPFPISSYRLLRLIKQ